jgi:hypothetical protein
MIVTLSLFLMRDPSAVRRDTFGGSFPVRPCFNPVDPHSLGHRDVRGSGDETPPLPTPSLRYGNAKA